MSNPSLNLVKSELVRKCLLNVSNLKRSDILNKLKSNKRPKLENCAEKLCSETQ